MVIEREKDWDEKFEVWKKQHKRGSWKSRPVGDRKEIMKASEGIVAEIEEKAEKTVEEVEKEIEEVEERIKEYVKNKPLYVRVLRVLAVLIPVLLILYLISANFLVAQNFEYRYDIGSVGENVLTPVERISQSEVMGDVTYRNLTGHLVYFDVPIARGAEKVLVEARIGDDFPSDGKASLGARNAEEWNYLYKRLYNPLLNVGGYQAKGDVYRLNENLPLVDEAGLVNLGGITIAAEEFEPVVNSVNDYTQEDTVIDLHLRGKHTFYVYAADYLEVYVEKEDINWYEGSDELVVVLYDMDGSVIELTQLRDDGIVDSSKRMETTQSGMLRASGLAPGVYKLEFNDFDGLISKIRINSNKVVADKVFLADNKIYGVDTKQSRLYFDYDKDVTLKLMTYHSAGLQKILFNRDGEVEPFNFNIEDEPMYREVGAGKYMVTFPNNDIIIESPEYLAFTPNGYFRPFKQKVVPINSPEWIMDSVDYLITDYVAPKREGDWIVVQTEFDIKEDGLFVNDQGVLSFVFNVPHLAEEGSNYTIPIDWIDVKVYKPGVWG